MRFALLAALSLACAKAPPPPGAALPAGDECGVGVICPYGGLLPLASAFAAKEACSCVFVAGRPEDDCAAWVKVSPAVASFRVDTERRRVVAHALGMAGAVAEYRGEDTGCVLITDP